MNHKKNPVAQICAGALLAAAGLAPMTAQAENWRPFFVVPGGVIMIDHDSVSFSPGRVTARLESTFPTPHALSRNGRNYTYVKTIDMVEVICAPQVYRNISRTLYGPDGLEAVAINEADDPIPVAPKTVQAALSTAYCK